MKYDLTKIENELKSKLSEYRFRHTQGVRYTAAALAMAYKLNLEDAEVAGLLHDCAKYMSGDKLIEYCNKHEIEISPSELAVPHLLHAKAGEYMAKHKYDISDQSILDAIRWHTTGRPEMTLLEKIIFVADYIEPMRDKAARLPEIRYTAFRDLDECIYMILEDTLNYLGKNTESIDETTKIAFEYYKRIH